MSNLIFNFTRLMSVFVLFLSVACTKKSENTAATPAQVVNLAIWGNYLSPEMAEKFTQTTGIKINISNYSSNEELLAKLQAGAAGIDVAVPSDYMVEIMAAEKLLEPLNMNEIPNSKGLDPQLLKQSFDPNNAFSLPYAWTTTGIAYNKELIKEKISSWKDLFESKEAQGKLSMLDDVREVMGAALKKNGNSLNSEKDAEIKKAASDLAKIKNKIKMFNSDVIDALKNKEVAIAQAYSSDALKAAEETKGAIVYVIPKEGATFAIDNVVIPKGASNLKNAHALINFLLSEEANVDFVTKNWGGPVLLATKSKLPESVQNNLSLFPEDSVKNKLERMKDLGKSSALYDKAWGKIKSE